MLIPPVGALPDLPRVVAEEAPDPQGPGLRHDDVEGAERLPQPGGPRRGGRGEGRASIADQQGPAPLLHRLQPEVIVNPSIGQEELAAVVRIGKEVRAVHRLERPRVQSPDHRREDGGEGPGGRHGQGHREGGVGDQPDPVIAGVGFREAEVHAGHEVRAVEDKARAIRQLLEGQRPDQVPPVLALDHVANIPERQQRPLGDGGPVDGTRAEGAKRRHDLVHEVRGLPTHELELPPARREQPRGDRPARDAGDPIQLREIPELVQPPDSPQVKEGGPEAPAGTGQAGKILQPLVAEWHKAPPVKPPRPSLDGSDYTPAEHEAKVPPEKDDGPSGLKAPKGPSGLLLQQPIGWEVSRRGRARQPSPSLPNSGGHENDPQRKFTSTVGLKPMSTKKWFGPGTA